MNKRETYKLALESEYDRWNSLINRVSDEKWDLVLEGYNWTLKDMFAHLMGWLQLTNAALSAGLDNTDPAYPAWLEGGDPNPESDEITDMYNARIYDANKNFSRQVVIDSWRNNFLTLMKTMDELSDGVLLNVDVFPWLPGFALIDVIDGAVDHHKEHYDERIKNLLDESPLI
jgi:hypothetical protein